MYDVGIIGAGPAGMTAAIYALRAGKSVLLIEAETFGGQITFSPRIENYPGIAEISGNAFASNLMDQTMKFGAQLELEQVLGLKKQENKWMIQTKGEDYLCKSIILATGAKHRKLGLAKEDELTGEGVSYCAVCDGAFFQGKRVAVVGGGNTALQDALFLSAYCEQVFLIHRRNTFRGEKRLVERLQEKTNITCLLSSRVTELLGDSSLQGIRVFCDETGKETELSVEGLFVAVGQIPQNSMFSDVVSLDAQGYVLAAETCETSANGIFAAGDCRQKSVRQLTTATADGAVAGLAACRYVDETF